MSFSRYQSTMTTEYEFSMHTIAHHKISLQNYFIDSVLYNVFACLLNIICFKNIANLDSGFDLGWHKPVYAIPTCLEPLKKFSKEI